MQNFPDTLGYIMVIITTLIIPIKVFTEHIYVSCCMKVSTYIILFNLESSSTRETHCYLLLLIQSLASLNNVQGHTVKLFSPDLVGHDLK